MSTCKFVAQVNKVNEIVAQFPPRDDRNPQEKLAKVMAGRDVQSQRFDCTAEGQAEFFSCYKNLEFLDPPKDKKAQSNSAEASCMVKSNNQIPKKK
eukprot:8889610-Ditylum_brightwellii.AAC.1